MNKKIHELTSREIEILQLIAQGKNNKSVAQKLMLSELTIKAHLKNIFKKLKASNRTQAIIIAIQREILGKEILSNN